MTVGGARISYRIIWVLIFSMVLFTVAMWMLFSFAYRYALKGVMNEYIMTAASELTTEIRLVVGADVTELKTLASSEKFRFLDEVEVRLELIKLVNQPESPFLAAYLMDLAGRVIDYGSSSRGEADPFGSMALPKEALQQLRQGDVYVSGVGPAVEDDGYYPKPYWVAAVPVVGDSGAIDAVLVGLADIGRIQDLVIQQRVGKSSAVYLTDREGRLLVRVDHGQRLRPGLASLAKATVAPGGVGVAVTDVNGVRTIYAKASMPNEGWGVLVGMDEAELLAGYHRLTVAVILGSVLLLGILVGASVGRINRILAPLYDLRTAVEKVGAGDYNIQVDIASSDEIGSLASTFNSMVARVREAERAKTEFISLASHELRTPLTSIKGYASTLLRYDVVWDEASRQEFLSTINLEADRLSRLVSDMLDVSRIDLGRLEFRFETFPMEEAVRQVARKVATTTERHRFFFEVPESLPCVKGDRDRVEQILHNLYSNAIKYSPSGGSINTTLRMTRDLRYVETSISDQGIGIDEDKLRMVFDRFYRVKDSKTSDAGGSGLGLYIVANLVSAMGGSIKVDSIPSKGSTFSFTIPVAERLGEVSA